MTGVGPSVLVRQSEMSGKGIQVNARGASPKKRTCRTIRSSFVLLAGTAFAASLLPAPFADVRLDVGDGSGSAGQTVNIAVTITSTGGSRASALNFDVPFDQTRLSIDPALVAPGAAALAVGKTVAAGLPYPGVLRVVVYGGNGALPDGELVRLPFVIAQGASGCAGPGCEALAVSDPFGGLVPSTCLGGAVQTGSCAPAEVTGLTLLDDRRTVTWSPAPACPGTVYDALRGLLDRLPVGSHQASETCLANDVATLQADDPETPQRGKGYWYLVRERSSGCSTGTYGSTSAGAPRISTTCP